MSCNNVQTGLSSTADEKQAPSCQELLNSDSRTLHALTA